MRRLSETQPAPHVIVRWCRYAARNSGPRLAAQRGGSGIRGILGVQRTATYRVARTVTTTRLVAGRPASPFPRGPHLHTASTGHCHNEDPMRNRRLGYHQPAHSAQLREVGRLASRSGRFSHIRPPQARRASSFLDRRRESKYVQFASPLRSLPVARIPYREDRCKSPQVPGHAPN